MDNIFSLGIETVRSKDNDMIFDKNYICYCSKCKTKFNSKEIHDYYNNCYGYALKALTGNKKEEEPILVACPNCDNTKEIHDLKKVNRRYQIFNEFFINDDKIKINMKCIEFHYYRDRLISKTFSDMIIFNMKTGYTYKFARLCNNKQMKGSPRIRNCTYSRVILPEYVKYSDKCKSLSSLVPDIYNAIRDYKINNNIVKDYIPTFEQNNIDCKNRGGYSLDIDDLILFNRFPCINVVDSTTLFCSYLNDVQRNYSKDRKCRTIRSKIKQDDSQIVKTILQYSNIPNTKINRKYLLEIGMFYVKLYNKALESSIDINNFYKILNAFECRYGAAFKIIESFKICAFTDKQINSLCNKILKHFDSNRFYFYVTDTFEMLKEIKENNSEYIIDTKLDFISLHDKVTNDYNRMKKENKKIDYSNLSNGINQFDYSEDGLSFRLAKDTHELLDVGNYMSICVGSYGNSALRHNCYIVIVRDTENNPIVCIELSNGLTTLVQAKLKYNNIPDEHIGKIIEKWCKINKIDYKNDRYRISEYVDEETEAVYAF